MKKEKGLNNFDERALNFYGTMIRQKKVEFPENLKEKD